MSADGNEDYGILPVPGERVMTSLPALPLPLLCSASAYLQLLLPNHIPNIVRKAYPLVTKILGCELEILKQIIQRFLKNGLKLTFLEANKEKKNPH